MLNKHSKPAFFERLQNLHLLPSRLYCRLWNRTKSCP